MALIGSLSLRAVGACIILWDMLDTTQGHTPTLTPCVRVHEHVPSTRASCVFPSICAVYQGDGLTVDVYKGLPFHSKSDVSPLGNSSNELRIRA